MVVTTIYSTHSKTEKQTGSLNDTTLSGFSLFNVFIIPTEPLSELNPIKFHETVTTSCDPSPVPILFRAV